MWKSEILKDESLEDSEVKRGERKRKKTEVMLSLPHHVQLDEEDGRLMAYDNNGVRCGLAIYGNPH